MPNISPTADSGYTDKLEVGTNILTARNYSSAGTLMTVSTDLRATGYSIAGSGGIYQNIRIYLNFDLSGESGIVTSAVLQLTSDSNSNSILNNGHKFYVVESDTGNEITNADYPNLKDRPSSGTYADIVPLYADSATAVSAANTQYNVTLNSAAISDLNSEIGTSTEFGLAIINEWDYTGDFTEGVDLDDDNQGSHPTHGRQGVEFHSLTATTGAYRPLLILTMQLPPTKLNIKSGKVIIKSGQLTIK